MSKSTKIFFIVIICVAIMTAAIVGIIKLWPNYYDTTKFNKVTTAEVVRMFAKDKTEVVFIGRKSCGACQLIIPGLQKAQKEAGVVVNYLDADTIEWESLDWLTLVEFLDMETTETISTNGEDEEITDTYGNLLSTYGFTPTLIIIKDGKMYDGHIGGATEEDLIEWLTEQTK